ncbi:hypothetical protein [Sulfurovum sp.]|uniref:hypothetical protein n=1 Tax=Sulfurovum sp. TaxID=1969726 RepID=UPI0025DDE128|nr:hypothetical protein [Sulfurovum sp.]
MLYYYAYTGHKIGLDRVKKAAAIIKGLESHGVECRLLVNDFRAGLAAREYGVADSITIETIQDIDAVAQIGNSVIIDSPEDDHGRLEKYCNEFNAVFVWRQNAEDKVRFSEYLLDGVAVDKAYEEAANKEKVSRKLFFLSDADYDKVILNHASLFENKGLELLLGHYFFVKYEDDLAKIFNILHEPEEYMDLIQSSKTIITSSLQTAFEAKMSGACVYFLNLLKADEAQIHYLQRNGIEMVQTIDEIDFKQNCIDTSFNQLESIVEDILQKLN